MMEKKWRMPEPLPAEADEALQALPALLRPVLYARGIRSREAARRYLDKPLSALHSPAELPDIGTAVRRIVAALEGQERIVVYGDYDVDGISGAALLVRFLRRQGAEVEAYIPDRFEEGYGLNVEAVERLAASAELLVTVDCGTRAVEEVQRAVELGLDVIITDHHHPGPQLPPALALVNPRQPTSSYPFADLAGVGLAYKLALALATEMGVNVLEEELQLVALGTVADLAPLQGENRILVSAGLEQLNATQWPGVAALVEAAGFRLGRVTSTNIAFGLGPRLNAAGRMKSGAAALELLLTEDMAVAERLASELEGLNRKRQERTRGAVELARELALQADTGTQLLFAAHEDFHEGVVGLAASRLSDEFYRPALVARRSDQLIKGSARSIPGFHITDELEAVSDLLLEFGGHAAAAGFTARVEDEQELRQRLQRRAAEHFQAERPQPELAVDAVVELNELEPSLLDKLDALEPFGQANQPPIFAAFGAELKDVRTVGHDSAHLKMKLAAGGRPFDAIGFRLGERLPSLSKRVDLAFHYEWNEYRGYLSPQLRVLDVQPAGSTSAQSKKR